ncbi:MAG TPA: OmpA family protein [Pseudacidobacterium sp.]|jgi:outer membrane protein OmpA-like peptidoglycan-associated protein|nr:OmpA family protein [Pseudacidobacterium sp.]
MTTHTNRITLQTVSALGALSLLLVSGCTTKNYVRSQTTPVIEKTNELDDATATNNRNLHDVDQRAQQGITQAQSSANQANQSAQSAGTSASQANQSAQDAVNRVDSLSGVVANLDNFKQVADVRVNFAFDKADLTRSEKHKLDDFAAQMGGQKSFILALTGGTDSVGPADYNYDLSQRRAQAVVQYLASKYNVPARRFFLVGIGKQQAVASNSTAAGRAENRRVDVQLLSNMTGGGNETAQTSGTVKLPQEGQVNTPQR